MQEQSLLNKDPRASFVIVDRDSEDWQLAWRRLVESGKLMQDYMLMHKNLNKGEYAFKHCETREYVYIPIDPRKQ